MNKTNIHNRLLSVIIPITERYDPITELFHEYKKGIDDTGLEYEFIYVLDGNRPDALAELQKLQGYENLSYAMALIRKFISILQVCKHLLFFVAAQEPSEVEQRNRLIF